MKDYFYKVRSLLTDIQIKQLAILLLLILIGVLFEMIGIGLIIPIIVSILDPEFLDKYPEIGSVVGEIIEPTYENIIIYGMLSLLLFYLVKTAYLVYLSYRQGVVIYSIKEEVSRRLFVGYMNKPYAFYLAYNSAQLIRNLTTEVGYFSIVLRAGSTLIVDGMVLIGVAIMLLYIEPVGTLIISIIIGVSAIVFQYATKDQLLKYGESRQYHEGRRLQHIQQGISSVKDVRILAREKEFIDQFNSDNVKGIEAERFQFILASIPRLWLEFVVIVGLAALLFVLLLNESSPGSISLILGVYAIAIFRLLPSVNRLLAAVQQLRYCWPSVNVVAKELSLIKHEEIILNKKQNVTNKLQKINLEKRISLCDLIFIHDGAESPTLDNININIAHGHCVGIVGGSGAGKSTLIDVMLGLLTPTDGHIRIDGVDIQDNLKEWQQKIGYVSQHIYLTDDSLRRNIAFGLTDTKIDNIAIDKAVDAAQLRQLIDELPEGMETLVGEHGVRLSGGQRQRIGIARALYHNPEVLILDEATSALDHSTESEIMQTIKALHGNKTIVIISHRESTLLDCDYIYRIEHGKIVNEGDYKEVIE